MSRHLFTYQQPLPLENGKTLPAVEIAYRTYGSLNSRKDNVIWICHALTANSDVADWWDTLVGEGKTYDPSIHFIVCANIIGSCYGSSGPLSINSETQKPFFSTFPQVTIRDMVNAHIILRRQLNIEKINTIVGGSMGGYQVLEWVLEEPGIFDKMVLVATSPRESAWGIAIHTAQRLAIEADVTWDGMRADTGAKGLKAARAIGMLTYRNYGSFIKTQTDEEHKLDNFKASSYINYQGEKLVKRFNAFSYWILGKAMDSHNIARGRGTMEDVLKSIKTKTIIIGISSDQLCPVTEQKFLAQHIPHSTYIEIDSPYGHDGFLIEGKLIGEAIAANP
ncbi:MAG TPA: homoserine O-acetyltransferase [Bacteroidia bacterium]|jgi:homoserine O-acetyltransferase